MALQIGDIVGDYEIIGTLGKGGMGTVFRVRNLLSDRVEAMKVALPDLNADPALADRFLREIRLHASLEHPHIAGLRTALRIDNQVLMIMELVEGASLDEHLRQGPLELKSAIRYVDQVLSALDLAHSRGIIHRDIKPANIIVTPEGSVKLTDFGIARSASERNLTQTGLALGSLYYMSPEQVQAQPADQRSDIYSLGVTFYEMATGRRPIDGASEYAILNAHLTHTPVPPGSLNPGVPMMLGAAIMKALAKQPMDRFQTAAEFREALRRIEGVTTLRAITDPGTYAQRTVVSASMPLQDAACARPDRDRFLLKSVGPIAQDPDGPDFPAVCHGYRVAGSTGGADHGSDGSDDVSSPGSCRSDRVHPAHPSAYPARGSHAVGSGSPGERQATTGGLCRPDRLRDRRPRITQGPHCARVVPVVGHRDCLRAGPKSLPQTDAVEPLELPSAAGLLQPGSRQATKNDGLSHNDSG